MRKTRQKRNLNLGAQPIISKVEYEANLTCMLSTDPKVRGHMITLKKIMLPFIQDKMKGLVTILLRKNTTILYSGIDSANLHFSNKAIHTGFIELVVVKKIGYTEAVNTKDVLKSSADCIIQELNEVALGLASDQSCVMTKEIFKDLKSEGGLNGEYFRIASDSEDRITIDFIYNISHFNEPSFQPFVEIRYLDGMQIHIFEKYGIFYMPLGSIYADVRAGLYRYGTPDWNFRETTLQQTVTRSGLTFSHWTIHTLLKLCYPSIAMRKMKSEDDVLKLINASMAFSPPNNAAQVNKLNLAMIAELKDCNNDAYLAKILTFDELYYRSFILGFLPENRQFRETLNNTYNHTILREVKISLLGDNL